MITTEKQYVIYREKLRVTSEDSKLHVILKELIKQWEQNNPQEKESC